jgi:hypothetical protein
MRLREREETEPRVPEVAPSDVAHPATDAVIQEGAQLLDAADQAIRRALSSNSEDFLAASRQQGGQ